MISDVLSDAAASIRQYIVDYPNHYTAVRGEVDRLLSQMDSLRQTLDTPPDLSLDKRALAVLESFERTLRGWSTDASTPVLLRDDLRRYLSWFGPIRVALAAERPVPTLILAELVTLIPNTEPAGPDGDGLIAYFRKALEERNRFERAMRKAIGLLSGRVIGSAARSEGHNARVVLEGALPETQEPARRLQEKNFREYDAAKRDDIAD